MLFNANMEVFMINNLLLIDEALSSIRKVYVSVSLENQIYLEKAITKLNCLKENLENPVIEPKKKTRQRYENRDAIFKVAIFLSRFGHSELIAATQKDALIKLSEILKTKPNYLKASRDAFDPFFNNKRAGWKQPLSGTHQNIYDNYKDLPKKTFIKEIREILSLS